MGMSASQARYLALTARMNDVEYQGQQINQQRTTLATQINELYNSLLDMSVPTPPSQKDFQKTVYSGTCGATKFTLGAVRPQDNGDYNIDLNYTRTGESFTKSTKTKTIIPNTPTKTYSNVTAQYEKIVHTTESVTKYRPTEIQKLPEDNDTDLLIQTTVGEAKGLDLLNDDSVLDANGVTLLQDEINKLNNNDTIYIKCNRADLNIIQGSDSETGSNIKTLSNYARLLNTSSTNLTNVEDLGDVTDFTNLYSVNNTEDVTKITGFQPSYGTANKDSDTNIAKLGLYTYGNDNIPVLINSVKMFEEALVSNKIVKPGSAGSDTVELNNPDYKSDGCSLAVKNADGSVSSLFDCSGSGKSKLEDAGINIDSIVKGLRNSFNLSKTEYPNDDSVLQLFSVYFSTSESGEPTPHFIRNKDFNSASTESQPNIAFYDFSASGTYTEATPTADCKLEFDTEGRITRIGIPSNGEYDWVDLTVSTETDETAYNEAMKDYNYAKIKYDKQQEEINIKTSIVQQQDKNLELKLTRLDNERTALNTELEAVKKVIQDNIDKTYKTFTG